MEHLEIVTVYFCVDINFMRETHTRLHQLASIELFEGVATTYVASYTGSHTYYMTTTL